MRPGSAAVGADDEALGRGAAVVVHMMRTAPMLLWFVTLTGRDQGD